MKYEHMLSISGQKSNWSGSTTLEVRKIPAEFNTISKLNEHFSKFGTVTNVQVSSYRRENMTQFDLSCSTS
jgi:hypothetical protein